MIHDGAMAHAFNHHAFNGEARSALCDGNRMLTMLVRTLVRYRMAMPPEQIVSDVVIDVWTTPFDVEFALKIMDEMR